MSLAPPACDVFLNTGKDRKTLGMKARGAILKLAAPLPDKPYCALKYALTLGRLPDLRRPRRFTEKVQARKLYDRNPLFARMADKAEVKQLVAETIGDRYAVPTLWVGTDLAEADWSAIPLPAVAKPTHASGVGRLLWTAQDVEALLRDNPSREWLAIDHASYNREWVYRALEPRIIVETMLLDDGTIPPDYRFFTFDGRVSHIEVDFLHEGQKRYCAYTPEWEKLPVRDPDYDGFYDAELPRPERLDEMLSIARTLGKGVDFVRVDLYASRDGIHVGELTLYPGGGFEAFEPASFDLTLGDKWTLGFALPG